MKREKSEERRERGERGRERERELGDRNIVFPLVGIQMDMVIRI